MNNMHLANDLERFVWIELFKDVEVKPDTTHWRLREKLLKIVRRWKSTDSRAKALRREAQFYIGLWYSAKLPDHEWAINTCVKLLDHIENVQYTEEKGL